MSIVNYQLKVNALVIDKAKNFCDIGVIHKMGWETRRVFIVYLLFYVMVGVILKQSIHKLL